MINKIVGQVTCEDINNLEIEIETELGVKRISAKKAQYPRLKQGDIFMVEFIKIERKKSECKCEDKTTDYHLLNCIQE